MVTKKSSNNLCAEYPNIWNHFDKKKVFSFSKSYLDFIGNYKTERSRFQAIIISLKKEGFKDAANLKKAKEGDKLFFANKNKTLFAFVVGKKVSDLRFIGLHLDSPRIDIKPRPLFEDSEFALFHSHHYGGIKRYNWVNTPLSLHGVVSTGSKTINISLGECDGEPKFIIPDLLVHLSKNQMERKGNKIVEAEEMKILVGSIPLEDKKLSNKIKQAVLLHLKKKYAISEKDFVSAELQFVPSTKPFNIGFDESLISCA
jgi:aspartyl aminopeptidase